MRRQSAGSWLAAVGACLLALAGCNDKSTVGVTGSDVRGSVGGVVLDAASLMPLAGVTATVVAGGAALTATTDDKGVFSVGSVPAGSVIVHLSADKHLNVYLSRTLDTSAGNFPLNNPALTVGPIAMVGNSGTFKVRLVDDGGVGAAGIKVIARAAASYVDLSNGGAFTSAGGASVTATSGMDGLATFDGLPDFNAVGPILNDAITVSVPPQLIMNAGEAYNFLGGDFAFNGRKAATGTPNIVLAGPRSDLKVVSSNLDYLESGAVYATPSIIKTGGPISIAFNQAVNPASVRALIYTEAGQLAAVTPTATVSANVVTINFGGKSLDAGTRYNFEFHASSLSDAPKEFNGLAPFFTPADSSNPTTVSTMLSHLDQNNPNDFVVVFSEPVGIGNGSSSQVGCVVYYEADLDGNAQMTSPAEWNPNGNASLKCSPGDPHAGYYLRPDELAAPATGFSVRWRLAVKPYAATCVAQYQCCVGGSTVHFQFSKNPDPTQVFRRLNGAPVADLTFQLPPFMCP